jgi:hypothetical protein
MKYKVRISNNFKHLYTATVEAKDEPEAIQKAMIEANLNGIILPEEFWCNTTKI